MQIMIKWLRPLTVCIALFFPAPGFAQESVGNPAAKAMFERAQAARREKKLDLAVEALRKAIELDPKYVAAHTEFISAQQSLHRQQGAEDGAPARIEAIYQAWIDANPKEASYYWGLGEVNYYRDPLKAERSCLKAGALDPKFAKAWHTLSLLAEMKGDNKASRDHLLRATEANPQNADYFFYYSRRVIDNDPVEGQKLALVVVRRFPASERAAQSLYWLGVDSEKPADKITYLERLRKEFPPNKFSWSSSGMSNLFDVYADTDPSQAIALGHDMSALMPKDTSWAALVSFEEILQKAQVLRIQLPRAEPASCNDSNSGRFDCSA
jgi:tetratricopeptide (TPR) repeat protein